MSAVLAGAHDPSLESSRGKPGGEMLQLVGCRLDNEDYAIAIIKIQEIILMKPITRIPQVPSFIEGLINLRGVVIPIINLRTRFGMEPRAHDEETRIIVLNLHGKTVGCVVDSVTKVMRIGADQVQPPPLTMMSVAKHYISGLGKLEDRLLIILDIERLFDANEMVVTPPTS